MMRAIRGAALAQALARLRAPWACYSRFSVSQPPQTARLYLVRGRVQGVGYRDYAQRVASALGLTGYVRNLDDGRVEVYAAGPPEKLSDLAAALRKGPRFSDVRGVDEQEAAPRHYSDFQIEV
jgi:acylphosphatase